MAGISKVLETELNGLKVNLLNLILKMKKASMR